MFNGIVEGLARVVHLDCTSEEIVLRLDFNAPLAGVQIGESIAINGTCLTVVAIAAETLAFNLASETLRATNLGGLSSGAQVNFERAMRLGDRVNGQLMSGHVDAVIKLLDRKREQGSDRLVFELPRQFGGMVVPKGGVALSGVALTVGEVINASFSTYLIPHTAQVTTLGGLRVGDCVNLEVDLIARYVAACIAR